jgi:ABC-type transport system involved in multi-copper enzyme maturation permease subunit
LRLRSVLALLKKDLSELFSSRAFWLLLLVIGPLVGHGFITAVDAYAEASGKGGGPAALAQGLSPLDGIFVPTFGAYDLAVTLLFPFVAIRLISVEKESGALKLLLQGPVGVAPMLLVKYVALKLSWFVAWIPGLFAIALWKAYGGTLYPPELLNLMLGHMLHFVLACAVAVAAASIAQTASSAAIIALGFTVGTWALEFVGMTQGGLLQKVAQFTPTSALRAFEQGQLNLSTVAVVSLLGLAGFAVADLYLPGPRRIAAMTALVAATALLVFGASQLRPSWDLSENRRNSFPPSAEASLRHLKQPLIITVNLAQEDPRRTDFDRNILSKLDRVVPQLTVISAARGSTGMFEGQADHYGEIWYETAGRKVMSRSTTEPIVLETIFDLAGVKPLVKSEEPVYPGHPLAVDARWAGWVFYGLWPILVGLAFRFHYRYGE